MADFKSEYSDTSKDYIEIDVSANAVDQERYNRSKARENQYNQCWLAQKVNLNDVVNRFILSTDGFVSQRSQGGIKYIFEGERYIIKCDKVAGYLRIYDKQTKLYCKLDGTPSRNLLETHFKIKRREEM